jgi:ABC-2 type transport system ATP-binding protein
MDEAEHCNTIGFIYYGNLLTLDTPNNMKEKTIDGDIAEIKADDTLKTIDILKTKAKVKEASVYGTGVHALIDPSLSLTELGEYLKKYEITFSSITKVKPSLEDVFVFLVNEANKKSASII